MTSNPTKTPQDTAHQKTESPSKKRWGFSSLSREEQVQCFVAS